MKINREKYLYEKINELLYKVWNPIGTIGLPKDEYSIYVPEILEFLEKGCSLAELSEFMNRLQTERMGLPSKPCLRIAAKIMEIYEKPVCNERTEKDGFVIEDGVLTEYNGSQVDTIFVPDGVSAIGITVFEGCDFLKKIVLPDSVKTIKEAAFEFCTNLETVECGHIEKIEKDAFFCCKKLKSNLLEQ